MRERLWGLKVVEMTYGVWRGDARVAAWGRDVNADVQVALLRDFRERDEKVTAEASSIPAWSRLLTYESFDGATWGESMGRTALVAQ